MNRPNDNAKFLLTFLYTAWVIAFIYSFVAYARAPDLGEGLSEGLRKSAVFLGWQGIAGILALAVFAVSLQWPTLSGIRQVAKLPLFLTGLIVAGVIGTIFWAGGFNGTG